MRRVLERETVLTAEEAAVLEIPRGSLTPEEYREIQSHVTHTIHFLSQIPWTRELARVAEIAGAHHETLDGSGYPYGRRAEAIPVPSRIMTIADIYDALAALDRPYKKAVPPARALETLEAERRGRRARRTAPRSVRGRPDSRAPDAVARRAHAASSTTSTIQSASPPSATSARATSAITLPLGTC